MKIGIIKENKIPNDERVPLSPQQCRMILDNTSHEVYIQTSDTRCFSDDEYLKEGVQVVKDVSHCDLLMGVKEVPIEDLIANKSYMFFSHTIKKQTYNRRLLQEILKKKIRLIDYETLLDDKGKRVIAFGKFAGMVGAHNGVMAFGSRTGLFSLDRMTSFLNYEKAKEAYRTLDLPAINVVLTGSGRVGNGAAQVLRDLGFNQLNPNIFLDNKEQNKPCFTQLSSSDYILHKKTNTFNRKEFYSHPENFYADFSPYYKIADIFVNGIYWNNKAPKFFTIEEMTSGDFNVQVIADVTCDIAPDASVPSTLRASTIAEPIFGFNPNSRQEEDPFQPDCVDVMSVDNLPNELPRDASRAFGSMFNDHVLKEIDNPDSAMIARASITNFNGELTDRYKYLQDYVSPIKS